jgi:hypothetical protein
MHLSVSSRRAPSLSESGVDLGEHLLRSAVAWAHQTGRAYDAVIDVRSRIAQDVGERREAGDFGFRVAQ